MAEENQKTAQELAFEQRQKMLDRRNRLTIYLPLSLLALLVLGITGVMLWLVLAGEPAEVGDWRQFASASADLVIILITLPFILMTALFPILALVWIWYTSNNRYPVERWLQRLLRRVDSFIVDNSGRVSTVTEQTANVSIMYRATLRRFGRIAEQIWTWIFRSPQPHQEQLRED